MNILVKLKLKSGAGERGKEGMLSGINIPVREIRMQSLQSDFGAW